MLAIEKFREMGIFSVIFESQDIESLGGDGYLIREGMVFKEWQKLCSEIFSLEKGDSFWGGRPDILLEKCKKDSNKTEQVFIGEVKYTDSEEYAARGLRELLEYMALIKIKSSNKYFEEKENIFKPDKIEGYLFVDKYLEIDNVKTPVDSNVNIVKFGDEIP